jgi:hypothetical protein
MVDNPRCPQCGHDSGIVNGVCRDCGFAVISAVRPEASIFSYLEKFLPAPERPGRKLHVDLSQYLSGDVFDEVLRAIESVLEESKELSLRKGTDRKELAERLSAALGAESEG